MRKFTLNIVKRACFVIMLAALGMGTSPLCAAVTADHQAAADFGNIPAEYFSQVRSNLNIYYGHTSHGSQVITGLSMLSDENASLYEWPAIFDDYDIDLGYPEWASKTRDYLNNHPETNLVMWSWCGQLSDYGSEEIEDYLTTMSQFETDYPNVTFVYMTGHLDGSGPSGTLYANNNRIRSFCTANKKTLFDFADIESHDPNGEYYPDGSDACEWCETWCESGNCPTCDDCAHSHCFNCYQKGKAFWWLMARISGWESDDIPPATDTQYDYYVQQDVGNDSNSGDTWGEGHALATIQRAIDLAKAHPKANRIYVATGTYYENLHINSGSSITLLGGYSAESWESGPNPTRNPVIIDGGESDRVITVFSSDNIEIQGVVIQNGMTTESGGGVYVDSSLSITISGNVIQNCISTEDLGGGIAVEFSDVIITDNIIQDNQTDTSGGGLSFYGDNYASCSGNVSGNTIKWNSGNYGGGMIIENADLTVSDNTMTENAAAYDGGAIKAIDCKSLTIQDNIIADNIAQYNGGALSINDCDLPTIIGNRISGNTAEFDGGGIFYQYAFGEISRNFIQDNAAGNWGGGICLYGSGGKIVNNVIYNNSALRGGGISYYDQSSASVINNTIVDNSASENNSGGIGCYDGSIGTVLNTILWGNTPGQLDSEAGSMLSVTFSAVQDGYDGQGNIPFDPLFISDTPPYDFHLQSDSICTGGGTVISDPPAEDIEGNPRPNPDDARPDIGAYEAAVTGYLVASQLWIKAIIHSEDKGEIEAVWKRGGEGNTAGGDRVIWGYFYANPSDVTWGSENNPDVFVKIWFDRNGRIDVNFFHVSVPEITVYSDYPYDSLPAQEGTTTMTRRYIRHYYEFGESFSEEQDEDGISPSGYPIPGDPLGDVTINTLRIGSVINTEEKGAIEAIWAQGGQDVTDSGDEVIWGYVYANPEDVTWGDPNNPDLFVKIWFDADGRIDVNFFHVSVPEIEVYSDYPNDDTYDQKGMMIMTDRYTRHEYQRD